MIKTFFTSSRTRQDAEEREKMAALESAERELRELQARGQKAVGYLKPRGDRNHWRESIEQMIIGAP